MALTRPRAARLLRTCPWLQVCVASGIAATLLTLALVGRSSPTATWLLLTSMAACGAAAAYILDGLGSPVVDATPTPRATRIALRVVVLLPPLAVGGAAVVMARQVVPSLPEVRLILVLLGYIAVGVAAASLLHRNGIGAPGDRAAVLVLLLVLLVMVVDPLRRWVPMMTDAVDWGRTAALWIGVIAVCACTIMINLREPAARPLIVRHHRVRQSAGSSAVGHGAGRAAGSTTDWGGKQCQNH